MLRSQQLFERLLSLWALIIVYGAKAYAMSTIWEYLINEPRFSIMSSCIEMAGHDIIEAFNGTDSVLTFFAIPNSKLHVNENICEDSASAFSFISYLASNTAGRSPYIGKQYSTLAGIPAWYYGLPVTSDVPEGIYFPIQFINDANITEILSIGKYTVNIIDRPIKSTVGTIWDALIASKCFTKLMAALDNTDLHKMLSNPNSDPITLFAPDDDAYLIDPPNSDPAVLYSYHALSKGAYPLSLNGRYFSQQLFYLPAGTILTRDIYASFYESSTQKFEMPTMAIPPLQLTRYQNKLVMVQSARVVESDIPAVNGVIHRISDILQPPPSVFSTITSFTTNSSSVLATSGTYLKFRELVILAGDLVESLLTSNQEHISFFVPTDQAIEIATRDGVIPEGPYNTTLSPDMAAEIVLYHTVHAESGPLLFAPSKQSPFQSNFMNTSYVETSLYATDVTDKYAKLWVFLKSFERSTLKTNNAGNIEEVYLNNARVYQCIGADGFGETCGDLSKGVGMASNEYALNGPTLCSLHAIDRLLMPPIHLKSLIDILCSRPDTSEFASILTTIGGLPDGIESGHWTLICPSNGAILELKLRRPWLFTSNETLAEIVRYHILPSQVIFSRYLNNPLALISAAIHGTAPILLSAGSTSLQSLVVNGFHSLVTDVSALDGVLHIVDGVLIPDLEQIAIGSGFQNQVSDFVKNGLQSKLQQQHKLSLLLLLNTEDSLGSSNINSVSLPYHIIPGDMNIINGGKFQTALTSAPPIYVYSVPEAMNNDLFNMHTGICANEVEFINSYSIEALNGWIYMITQPIKVPGQSIMDILGAETNTTYWKEWITTSSTELVNLLSDPSAGPFTIFAPSDSAIASIGKSRMRNILQNKQLSDLVRFHSSNVWLTSYCLANATEPLRQRISGSTYCGGINIPTMNNGMELRVEIGKGGLIFVSTEQWPFASEIIRQDLIATNGVVHVISQVLTYFGYTAPA